MIRRLASIATPLLLASLLAGCAVSVTTRPSTLEIRTAAVVPQSKDDCKDGGWRALVREDGEPFRNQGDCVSYVASGR